MPRPRLTFAAPGRRLQDISPPSSNSNPQIFLLSTLYSCNYIGSGTKAEPALGLHAASPSGAGIIESDYEGHTNQADGRPGSHGIGGLASPAAEIERSGGQDPGGRRQLYRCL